jgi:retron-type reverse transcriptase
VGFWDFIRNIFIEPSEPDSRRPSSGAPAPKGKRRSRRWRPPPPPDDPAECIPRTALPRVLRRTVRHPYTGRSEVQSRTFSEGVVGYLGLRRRRLLWLAYHHPRAYRRRGIPKPGGGERVLHEPCPALKKVQRRILRGVLDRVILHRCCHGFRSGASILTNAVPHEGKEMVVGMDLEDFFPSITFPRVFGIFRSLGLSPADAGLFARLTTWEGRLPQGAPTSPQLANIVCRRLDYRLANLSEKAGAAYTRYADDLAFSGGRDILRLLPLVRTIVAEEGFRIAEAKTRIQRLGRRQKVCGVVVNERANLPRELRRRIRAVRHRASLPPEQRKGPTPPRAVREGYEALLHLFEDPAFRPAPPPVQS